MLNAVEGAPAPLEYPKWHKDLAISQSIKTTYVVEGNVNDLQAWVYPDEDYSEHITLDEYLYRYLESAGYDTIVFYNRVDGFTNPFDERQVKTFLQVSGFPREERCSFEAATTAIRTAMDVKDMALAIVFNMANTAI